MVSLAAIMNKGMWTSFLYEFSPEEAVRLFAEKGWTHLELSTEHGAALLERGDPVGAGERFRRFCADLGVSLPQGHLKLTADIAHPDPSQRRQELEELKQWIDLFAALGIQAGVLHPGGGGCLTPEWPTRETFDANVESLRELVEHAAGRPPVICLENGGRAADLLLLIEAAGPDGLGICFDTGHLSVLRTMAPEAAQGDYEFILEARDYLKALHIADNDGSGDQHLLPFEGGKVDWQGVMRGLRDIGYNGLFNFEIPGESCWPQPRPLPERLEKLERAAQIADRLMETMGRSLV